jgi:ABC-type glycerol-3-phosphate transport system substrate-binding protein
MSNLNKKLWFIAALMVLTLVVLAGGQSRKKLTKFVVWSYSIETIQDNINLFEQAYPGVQVELSDFGWNDYHDILATRFTSGTPTEVSYSSDHWLQEWGSGPVAPLTILSRPAGYVGELAPYAVWHDG